MDVQELREIVRTQIVMRTEMSSGVRVIMDHKVIRVIRVLDGVVLIRRRRVHWVPMIFVGMVLRVLVVGFMSAKAQRHVIHLVRRMRSVFLNMHVWDQVVCQRLLHVLRGVSVRVENFV